MSATLLGQVDWSMERSNEGHRDYNITWLVTTDDPNDGPGIISITPGLPSIGSQWAFGNDGDPWALCWPNLQINPVITHEPNYWWTVTQRFTTRPIQRCQNTSIENPLFEPYKINGNFNKRTKLIDSDYQGNPVRSSSQERLTGGVMEFDDNRPTVHISFNQLDWPGSQAVLFVDSVNDSDLWGLPPRTVKLSNVSWQRNLWGICNFYFTVNYEFELAMKEDEVNPGQFIGWDRYVQDKGYRCLRGYSPGLWEVVAPDSNGNPKQPTTNSSPTNPLTGLPWVVGDIVQPGTLMDPNANDPVTGQPNYLNPENYVAYRLSQDGEITECFLDGLGRPVRDVTQAKKIFVQYYPQNNLLELNIPADLNFSTQP